MLRFIKWIADCFNVHPEEPLENPLKIRRYRSPSIMPQPDLLNVVESRNLRRLHTPRMFERNRMSGDNTKTKSEFNVKN